MIGRVLRIWRAELRKLRGRALGWAPLGAGALAAALAVGAQGLLGQLAGQRGGAAAAAPSGFYVLAQALHWGVLAGTALLVILGGMLLAEERELGTAKAVFSKPLRRVEVVWAKGLALLVLAVLLVLVVAAVGGALAGWVYGYGDIVDPAFPDFVYHTAGPELCPTDGISWCMPRQSLRAAALMLPPLAALLLVALCISACARQSGVAVGLAFAALLLGGAAGTLFDGAAPYLATSYLALPVETLREYATGQSTALWLEAWPRGPRLLAETFPRGVPKFLLGLGVSLGTGLVAWALGAAVVAWRPVLALLAACGLGAGVLLGPGAAAARAQAAPRFHISQHRVPGQVWEIRPADVDRDGRSDLVVFFTRDAYGPEPERYLAIFYLEEDGYPIRPQVTLPVPPEAVARFVAELDPAHPGLEIGLLTPHGLSALVAVEPPRFAETPRVLFSDVGFFDMGSGNQLPSWDDGVQDVDGDGRPEVLFPRKQDAALYRAGAGPEGAWAEVARVPLEHTQRYGSRVEQVLLGRFLSVDARLGRPVLARVDPDARLDLVAMRERAVEVYLQRAEQGFPRDPDWRIPLAAVLPEPGTEDELNRVGTEIVDVDGDGWAELIVFRNTGQIGVFSSLRTQVILFRGGERGWSARPTQIINIAGLSIEPVLLDLDGDGKRDLVLSSVRTDLITNVKQALFSSVTVTYLAYRYEADEGRFARAPSFSRDLTVDVARLEGGGTVPLAYFWGDFDGDGRRDMLVLAEQDRVAIHPGRAGGGLFGGSGIDFAASAEYTVEIETSNSLWMEDLDRDGRHDLVFWYWADAWKQQERGKFTVMRSR
ncbi:MAG: hypothetical protein KatS3mg102_0743 [Planctomycetota bacterium]|nr:MAG: hypothetical protein KatS3mg102_0743 [Planctomycetota bacterium]